LATINEAAARSMTFRGLVNRINSTDGIVYVSEGRCGHGVWACLSNTMTMAGPNRVLRILRRLTEGGSRTHGIHRA
jgi:hypothetical protein